MPRKVEKRDSEYQHINNFWRKKLEEIKRLKKEKKPKKLEKFIKNMNKEYSYLF